MLKFISKIICCGLIIGVGVTSTPTYAISVNDEQVKLDIPGLPFSVNVSKSVFNQNNSNGEIIENTYKASGFDVQNKTANFSNGDSYVINRLTFTENKSENHIEKVFMSGEELHIKYVYTSIKEEVYTTDPNKVAKTTMMISSEEEGFLVGIPAVYKNSFESSTLTSVPEKEELVGIEKVDGGYNLIFSFPHEQGLIGEFWYMKSPITLMDKEKPLYYNELLYHDLYNTMRWSYDGFYFKTPSNYTPGGDNVYYNHPSSYTGGALMRSGGHPTALNYAYVTTLVCMENQNDMGYFKTYPSSEWLSTDFKIGGGFYDTRFNTDFARHLVKTYERFPEQRFLDAALKYGDFYIELAENNHYVTSANGILVEDYWHESPHIPTHSSLNHHLAELNFLYEIYNATQDEKYLDLANRMLQGVADTESKWILPDGNLVYALYYTGSYMTLVDYPYLTYNDLMDTKFLLSKYFNTENTAINNLINSKKGWMDKNGVKGYVNYVAD